MAVAMRLPAALALASVLLLAGSAGASSHGSQAGATASAYGVKVVVPNQAGAVSTSVSAPPNAVGFASGFAYPSDGSILTTGPVSVSASTNVGTNARSIASSSVSSLSLFGGEVTAANIAGHANASTSGQSVTGSLAGAAVTGLTVGGVAQAASPNGRVALGDWGYAITLEQAEVHSPAGKTQSYRGYVTGLDIHLTADHGGLPAGSEILVGYTESWAQAGTPPPVLPPAPGKGTATKKKSKAPAKKTGKPQSLGPAFRIPFGLQPQLTAGGYVFPVYGPHDFTDTFGAFRGDVPGNWHHGDDIFAPLGAPVLACADGTVFSVGWNNTGGNRLWLRDGQGNEFYYAHLSAYSPAAKDGSRVKAGEVVGFIGNTGDAEGTPYHLHFEVHPVAYLSLGYDGAVDPTPYLLAWQHQKDLYLAQVAGYLPGVAGDAPKPGAILLQSSDISQANGLDPASLRRAFFTPLTASEGGRLATVSTLLGP
ncbi:MAG: M23 family metallopeptidase [Actinobacteria bacterium]|nr:MAG: M23 family metallopeptidase [Actinomycetota bacterium]